MRIAILTFESPQSNAIVGRVLAKRGEEVCGIVRATSVIPRKTAWQSLRFVVRRCALEFLAWKATEAVVTRLAVLSCRLRRRTPAVISLQDLTLAADVPLVGTTDVNAAETVALLRGWRPDVVISVYFNQLIRAPVFAICPVINVHGGRLPEGRGLFPYFWALVNGDATAGATVHWMDEHFDTGDLLYEGHFPISADDTVHSVAWRSADTAADLLLQALDAIEAGTPRAVHKTTARDATCRGHAPQMCVSCGSGDGASGRCAPSGNGRSGREEAKRPRAPWKRSNPARIKSRG